MSLNSLIARLKNITLLSELLIFIINLATVYLITNYYSLEIYGVYILLITIASIFTDIIGVRSNELILYFVNKYKNDDCKNGIVFIVFGTDLVVGTIISISIYFLSSQICFFFHNQYLTVELVNNIALYAFFIYLKGSFLGLLQVNKLYFQIAAIKILESLLKFISIIFLIYNLQNKMDFLFHNTLLLNIISMMVIGFFIVFILFNRNIFDIKKAFVFNKINFKEFYSYVLNNFYSTILKSGNRQIDSILITKFASVYYLGMYDISKKLLSPISIITNTITITHNIKIIEFISQKQFIIKKFINNTNNKIIFLFIFYTILIVIFKSVINKTLNVNLDLIFFVLVSISVMFSQLMWWTRPFSISHNIKLSIVFNFYSTFYSFTVLTFLSYLFGNFGLVIGLIFIRVIMLFLWNSEIDKYLKHVV